MYKVILDKKEQIKIIDTIENKLANDPFIGKKLMGNLSEFYKYRVGNYRIIYSIFQEIVEIGHRKDVYKK